MRGRRAEQTVAGRGYEAGRNSKLSKHFWNKSISGGGGWSDTNNAVRSRQGYWGERICEGEKGRQAVSG